MKTEKDVIPLSSLDVGSKHRLKSFRQQLMKDYDKRNFDHDVLALLNRFIRPAWETEFNKTVRYLNNLVSSEDGKKFSQGVKEYSKLLKAGKAFSMPNHTYFGWNEHYQSAKSKLKAYFGKYQRRPRHYHSDDDIAKALPKLGTHAGYSFILTGKKYKREHIEGSFSEWSKRLEQAKVRGSFETPILPAVRTQGTGNAFDKEGNFLYDCKHKTRMVSMVDFYVILTELMFSQDIQDIMASSSWYAGGKDMETEVAGIIRGLRSRWYYWTSLDYSSFDSSISAWLIHDAFEIMREAFVLTEDELKIFQIVERDFIEKDFIFGEEIIHSVKGVPSGSMFTQIVDSIVNILVIQTYLSATGNSGEMIVMGDDNLVYTVDPIDREHLESYLAKNFGMTVNAQKTECGKSKDDPQFLSTEWRTEGRYREEHVTIGKLLYAERERIYKHFSPARRRGKSVEDCGTPQETLWSYCLAYPITMRNLINVREFIEAFPELKCMSLKDVSSQSLPGHLRFVRDYTGGHWSNLRKAG